MNFRIKLAIVRMMIKSLTISKEFQARLLGLLLLALIFCVYWKVIDFDFILFDDPGYVLDNDHVRAALTWPGFLWAFTTFSLSNWHPLTWLSHMLDVQLFGLNPAGHHLMSVIIHSVNSLLLFLLLRETTGCLFRSFMVAILFALHPLHIESVVWISERKDLLCAFFGLMSILYYVRYVRNSSKSGYMASLLFFLLGLMSKPMIVTLPFVLLLLDFWPLGRLASGGVAKPALPCESEPVPYTPAVHGRQLVYEKIPFFILSILSSILTFVAQQEGGAVQSLGVLSLKSRLLNALYSYLFYIWKLFFPQDLSIYYPHPDNSLNLYFGGALLLLFLSVTILIMRLALRKPHLAVGWLWYLGTLVPVIGIVQVGGQGMANRYTYLPLIGLFMILVWGLAEIFSRIRSSVVFISCLVCVLMVMLVVETETQLSYWKNTDTLFRRALEVTPDNVEAYYMLAVYEERLGDKDKYRFYYGKAVSINPGFIAIRHNRLGNSLVRQGKYDAAIVQFERALEAKSDYASAQINLGIAYAEKGDFAEASRKLLPLWQKRPRDLQLRESVFNVMRQLATHRKPFPQECPQSVSKATQ